MKQGKTLRAGSHGRCVVKCIYIYTLILCCLFRFEVWTCERKVSRVFKYGIYIANSKLDQLLIFA